MSQARLTSEKRQYLYREEPTAYLNHAIKHNKSIPRHITAKFWNIGD